MASVRHREDLPHDRHHRWTFHDRAETCVCRMAHGQGEFGKLANSEHEAKLPLTIAL